MRSLLDPWRAGTPGTRHRLATLRAIHAHPRATRERLVRFQTLHLKHLIAHAYRDVPYYRRLFDSHGLTPDDVRTPADLARVPLTTRAAIQQAGPEEMLARGVVRDRLVRIRSSGSTGRPLSLHRSSAEERILGALRHRAMATFGVLRRERVAVVRRVLASDVGSPAWTTLARTFVHGPAPAMLDCDAPPAELLRQMASLRPACINGYPGVLARLTRLLDRDALRGLGVRAVVTGGEVLTADARREIAHGFGAPVWDLYASWEFNLMAWECRETGQYHVCDDGLVLEVVRDGRPVRPGEAGTIVGTCLHSYAMPLIRYEVGDLAVRGADACACGQPFATIAGIQGRVVDLFTLPDGRVVHPFGIFSPIRDRFGWIREYQVTQRRTDHFVMTIVAEPPPTEADVALLRDMAHAKLGPGVRCDVETVTEIPLEQSGKFRTYRSLVTSDAPVAS